MSSRFFAGLSALTTHDQTPAHVLRQERDVARQESAALRAMLDVSRKEVDKLRAELARSWALGQRP